MEVVGTVRNTVIENLLLVCFVRPSNARISFEQRAILK